MLFSVEQAFVGWVGGGGGGGGEKRAPLNTPAWEARLGASVI